MCTGIEVPRSRGRAVLPALLIGVVVGLILCDSRWESFMSHSTLRNSTLIRMSPKSTAFDVPSRHAAYSKEDEYRGESMARTTPKDRAEQGDVNRTGGDLTLQSSGSASHQTSQQSSERPARSAKVQDGGSQSSAPPKEQPNQQKTSGVIVGGNKTDTSHRKPLDSPADSSSCWSYANHISHMQSADPSDSANNDFHIAGLMLLWKRPEVTKMVLTHTASLMNELRSDSIRVTLTCGGSEASASKSLCRQIGADYIELENKPLGKKHNLALKYLHEKQPSADAIILMPSDDIANAALFRMHRDIFLKSPSIEVSGVNGIYFLDSVNQQMLYEAGYSADAMKTRKDSLIGSFRAFRPRFFERLTWSPWPDEAQSALDKLMWEKAAEAVAEEQNKSEEDGYRWLSEHTYQLDRQGNVQSLEDMGVLVIDVKSADNVWSFGSIVPACHNGRLMACKIFNLSYRRDEVCSKQHNAVCHMHELFDPCVFTMIKELANAKGIEKSIAQKALVPVDGLLLGSKQFCDNQYARGTPQSIACSQLSS